MNESLTWRLTAVQPSGWETAEEPPMAYGKVAAQGLLVRRGARLRWAGNGADPTCLRVRYCVRLLHLHLSWACWAGAVTEVAPSPLVSSFCVTPGQYDFMDLAAIRHRQQPPSFIPPFFFVLPTSPRLLQRDAVHHCSAQQAVISQPSAKYLCLGCGIRGRELKPLAPHHCL